MSTKKAKIVVLVTLAGAALVVACGSGSDPVITLGSPYEQRAGDFAKPTQSNQDPSPAQGGVGTVTATAPPKGGKDGGTSGNSSGDTTTSGGTSGTTTSGGTSGTTTSGGTSGSTAGCPPCDGTFTCDVMVTGAAAQKTTVMLVTKSGGCTFSSQSMTGDIVFACGGALTSGGQNVGTWANCSKATAVTPSPDAG
jgi:hypothetical protein